MRRSGSGLLRYGSVFVSQDNPQSDISNLAASLVNHGLGIDRGNESCQFAANRITGWRQLRALGGLPTAKQQADGTNLLLEQDIFHSAFYHKTAPHYPESARSRRVEGSVWMMARIAPDGSVTQVYPISGQPEFVEVSVTALKNWKFHNPLVSGQPAEVIIDQKINYTLH